MRVWLLIAAVNGFLAVASGAFAAHALQGRLDAHAMSLWETAARYHMYHALAIGLAAFAIRDAAAGAATVASSFFLAGILLFCDTQKQKNTTNEQTKTMITPKNKQKKQNRKESLAFAATRLKV